MKVGVVIPSFHGGGAEFVARRWINHLCEQGNEVYVYTYDPTIDCPFGARVTHRRFTGGSRIARFVGLPFWLRAHVKRDGLEVLLSLLTFTNLLALVGLRVGPGVRVPVVISERSIPTIALSAEGRSGNIKRRLARRLYRRADAVIAISHPVAGDLIGGYGVPLSKLYVVPNPVVKVDRPQQDTGLTDGSLRVALVGRLVEAKRPELFIDTLETLSRRGVAVDGVLIGDGPLREVLERRAARSEVEFVFPGWCEPWWESMQGIDCLLLSSLIEGFGNVLVEAAQAGIPCVAASSALGVADAIVPGITGELARDDTPEELAQAVLRATASRHGNPVDRWLECFSVEHSASVLTHVLERVVSESRAARS